MQPHVYNTKDLARLFQVTPGSVGRKLKSLPNFPAPIQGAMPKLWSGRAVDRYFNPDAGPVPAAGDEASQDPIERARKELEAKYAGAR